MLETIFAFIAPHDCLLCGTEGSLLCDPCSEVGIVPVPSRCVRCLKPTIQNAVCSHCRDIAGVKRVWVATEYNDVAKQLVHAMKYDHARAAAIRLAELLSASMPPLPRALTVVPIPTALPRVRQRGFDHAKLLAKRLAALRGLVYWDGLRRQTTTRQVGASRAIRIAQLADAFRVQSKSVPRHILLIDDVYTTGSTVQAAALAIKAASQRCSLYAAVFAHKP